MSIYGAMYSGVSGLAAQSNALGVISDNISNVNTVGYKGSRATFQTLVTQATTQTTYTPGGVGSRPMQGIDKQGLLQGTSNATDLAISGNGMFVVNEAINPGVGDDVMFTRAGEFRPDEAGNLRNAAGFYLQGWRLDENGNLPPAQQSINSVETVNVSNLSGLPRATDQISVGANLPSGALDAAADGIDDTRSGMTVQIFDALGNAHNLSIEFSRLTDAGRLNGEIRSSAVDGATGTTDPLSDATSLGISVSAGDAIEISDGNGNSVPISYNPGDSLDNIRTAIDGTPIGAETLSANFVTLPSGDQELVITNTGNQQLSITGDALAQSLRQPTLGSNDWNVTISAPVRADDPNGGASAQLINNTGTPEPSLSDTITFNGDGSIGNVPATLSSFGLDWSLDPTDAPNGTDADPTQNVALNFGTPNGFDGLTQFDSNFGVNEINQNGLKFGNFTGVNVNDEGTVTAVFDNGRRKDIYQLPIAMFSNFNGLQEVSGNAYLQTRESGDFLLTESGVGGAGNVAPSAVEASTVDLAEEFTKMITTQRAYSASTKVITTSDEMLQELTQAIR
jgi:flagellar hook protein FlgE